MKAFLKILAWTMIVGGGLAHPIIYGLMIIHHLNSRFSALEAYLIPQEAYEMIFGIISSVIIGTILLILLDIRDRLTDNHPASRF